MKKLLTFLLALGFSAAALAATKTMTLSVKGWTCGSCAAATRIALKKLDGVQEVKTNLEKAEVVVAYEDAKVTPEKMIQAVGKLGYKASVRGAPSRPIVSAQSEQPVGAIEPAGVARDPSPRQLVSPDRVTLFETPLGCWAVEGLGCGGLSKPILLGLERDPKIAEAWLNYSGTVLSVVWKDPGQGRADIERVEAIFNQRGLDVMPLQGAEREEALKDFRTSSKWYRGADVDRLSEEEARVVAARLVRRVEKSLDLPSDRAAALREDVTAVLRRLMVTERPTGRNALAMRELLDAARKNLNGQELREFEKALALGIRRLPEDAS